MNKITTQIKFIGLTFSLVAMALAALTLFLNQKSKNDAMVVNIAGKERMLTQKMAKELFLGFLQQKSELGEFEAAKREFLTNLDNLTQGDETSGLTPPPTKQIADSLALIKKKSDEFFILSYELKNNFNEENAAKMYASNNELLSMVDSVVGEYAREFEAKRERLESLQYVGGFFIFAAILMSVYFIKKIDVKFNSFLNDAKEIGSLNFEHKDVQEPMAANAGELDVAKSELKNFISEVEKVVVRAQSALDESQNAITELESSAKIVEKKLADKGIDEKTKKEMESYIDKSEDLTIGSLEDIALAKEMLQKFKETLQKIKF